MNSSWDPYYKKPFIGVWHNLKTNFAFTDGLGGHESKVSKGAFYRRNRPKCIGRGGKRLLG